MDVAWSRNHSNQTLTRSQEHDTTTVYTAYGMFLMQSQLENVEHCGGEPERTDTW